MSLKFEFSREELNDIIERYNNWESMCSISEDYSCSYQVIKRTLKEQGVFDEFRKIRRYFVDESAFAGELDEVKAYWLGFLIADGCLKEYTIYLDRKFKRANSLIEKYKNKVYIKRQKKIMSGDRKVIKVESKFVLFSNYLKELGILEYYNIIYNRFYIYGWSLEKAVTTPFKRKEVL